MNKYLLTAGLGLGLAMSGMAQKPKSQAEVTALQATFAATDPDAQITAASGVLEKFADTEFKSVLLQMIASDYQRKNDFPKAVTYGERSLEADPKNFQAMLVLASEYVQNTRDTDFDKEEKLKKADKYSNDTIAILKDAAKPNPNLPDAQWEGAKKDMIAQAHEILGQAAMVRKKPDLAATEFQTAVNGAATQEPATYVRLATADNMLGKYDDAIAAAEKAMNTPNAAPAVKQFAQAERARAMQAKNKGAAPSSAAPSSATPGANAPAGTPPPPPATAPPAGSPPPQQ